MLQCRDACHNESSCYWVVSYHCYLFGAAIYFEPAVSSLFRVVVLTSGISSFFLAKRKIDNRRLELLRTKNKNALSR